MIKDFKNNMRNLMARMNKESVKKHLESQNVQQQHKTAKIMLIIMAAFIVLGILNTIVSIIK
jgi:uncharacterized membrane protein YgcG